MTHGGNIHRLFAGGDESFIIEYIICSSVIIIKKIGEDHYGLKCLMYINP